MLGEMSMSDLKKYFLWGAIAGIALSFLVVLLKRKELKGTEFHDLFDKFDDSDELFIDTFQKDLPDQP